MKESTSLRQMLQQSGLLPMSRFSGNGISLPPSFSESNEEYPPGIPFVTID